MLHIVCTALLLCAAILRVNCLTHERTLMWTLKSTLDGSVDVRGIPGDPNDWVFNGIKRVSNSYFSDPTSRSISRRLALAFQYSTHRLFSSDIGFKQIFRIVLQTPPNGSESTVYNVPIEVVYGGISTQVNGMAMDWASGSLYWTDALYNWITVANASDYNMAKRIINTGVSRPMGLAVYPQKGLLFWSSIGAVPKIERSTLSGQSRINFVDSDIDRPLGLSIDYNNDHLYWVDDLRDTIERVQLDDPTDRWSMHVGYRHSLTGKLFGLATFEDFIFVTDQLYMTIDIFNKSTGLEISNFTATAYGSLAPGIPYDIMMYDSSLQETIDSDCKRLNCSDICISDGGQKAHCICQEGYSLSTDDHQSCVGNATFRMPQYLYSVGEAICGTDIIAADQEYVPIWERCFYNVSGHSVVALGFNVYEGVIYFSDRKDRTIHKMTLSDDVDASNVSVIIANTGNVTGIAIDWIADNLYWTDEVRGVIMVSRVTGRYGKVLFQDLDRPQSIAVNPLNGTLYWATPDTIYMASMDGTNVRTLVHIPGSNFDGMVLDIVRDRLLWVDQSLPGIRSCRMNGSELAIVLHSDNSIYRKTFLDVTVYQNYIAWTDGGSYVYFGVTSPDNSSVVNILRGIQHINEKISHDIITYDYYLQPPLNPGQTNPCDTDNDIHGCSQLCLLTPTGSQCSCSAGFTLVGTDCVSEPLTQDFLMFVDPYYKVLYQYDLRPGPGDSGGSSDNRLRGIALQSANIPSLVTYDLESQMIFWFDEDRLKNSIKQISIYEPIHYSAVSIFDKGVMVTRIEAVDRKDALLYVDSSTGSVFLISLGNANSVQRLPMKNVYESAVAVDECTGEIFWADNVTNTINKCSLNSSCFSDSDSNFTTFFSSWTEDRIMGINIAQNVQERTLIAWTGNKVYSIRDGTVTKLFTVDASSILTGVVMDKMTIYFATDTQNAIFQYDMKTTSTKVVIDGFSKISDLEIFVSGCITPEPDVSNCFSGLGTGAIIGIAFGVFGFLLLLILLIILLIVLCRRCREKQAADTVAYSNPTYGRLNSIASTLSHMPEGAEGYNPYSNDDNNNNDKDKTLPPAYDDLYLADDAIAAVGFDGFLYTKEAPECEKKEKLPFPEVSVLDPPIFKIEAGSEVKPSSVQANDSPEPHYISNPYSLPDEEEGALGGQENFSTKV